MQKRKRTRQRNNKKADLILTADWHLRDDQPVCRTDDYFQTQNIKLNFILQLKHIYNCPVLIAGDLFNKDKSSKELEIYFLHICSDYDFKNILALPGQHDLPNHNLSKIDKSSIGVLSAAKSIELIRIANNEITEVALGFENEIGACHTFIQKPGDKQDDIIGGSTALSFLKKHKEFKLIVTGDNHKTFVVEHEGRLLVNPGSMMRMTAGQMNHKPCVFLYYADTNTVQPVYLPIEDDVISREHIEEEEKKDKRFQAFVQRLNKDYEVSLSFEKNMKTYIIQNKVRSSVNSVIWEAMS